MRLRKTKKNKKFFFRALNSNDFPSEINFQINLVLLSFHEKSLSFNSYYLPFIELVMECNKSREYRILLNQMLDFLIYHPLSNIDLKHFINNSYNFIKFYLLHKTDYFAWEYEGNYAFLVTQNYLPKFYFEKVNLMLLNKVDTINIFNATGSYDLLNNDFKGNYAESDFIHEDFFSHFTFTDFTLDLNKNFLKLIMRLCSQKGLLILRLQDYIKTS